MILSPSVSGLIVFFFSFLKKPFPRLRKAEKTIIFD